MPHKLMLAVFLAAMATLPACVGTSRQAEMDRPSTHSGDHVMSSVILAPLGGLF